MNARFVRNAENKNKKKEIDVYNLICSSHVVAKILLQFVLSTNQPFNRN